MRDSVHDKAKTLFSDTMLDNQFFFFQQPCSIAEHICWVEISIFFFMQTRLQYTRVWAATSKQKIGLVWSPHKLQCGTR